MSESTSQSIERDLRAVVAELDPDAVPLCEVLGAWKRFNAIETLAASAKTLLARRVEEGNTWRSAGYRSAAEQLAGIAGSSVNTAKKELETSKRVKRLPRTASAMRKGKLSPAKAEAIVSAAHVDPDAEGKLLEGDTKPLAEVREECLNARGKDRDRSEAHV